MIIGLCGPEGAGKSTVAKLLRSMYGCDIKPLAGPLKRMLLAMGVPKRNLYGSTADKAEPLDILRGKSAREAMQLLGTEWGRQMISNDLWLNAWRSSLGEEPHVIADDVRFSGEAQAIHDLGGVLICIVRSMDDFNRIPRHASEAFGSLQYDALVINDGTKKQLASNLQASLLTLQGKASSNISVTA